MSFGSFQLQEREGETGKVGTELQEQITELLIDLRIALFHQNSDTKGFRSSQRTEIAFHSHLAVHSASIAADWSGCDDHHSMKDKMGIPLPIENEYVPSSAAFVAMITAVNASFS
jgi:hypothetical protein